MSKYTFLNPIEPAEECYLSEVLLWRAFGRFPELSWISYYEPCRFSPDIRDTYEGPIPDGKELSDGECKFAGIPEDPRAKWLLIHDFPVEEPVPEKFGFGKQDHEEQRECQALVEAWLPYYREYVDQFQNEICLDLQRGNLVALGTELPDSTYTQTVINLDEHVSALNDQKVIQIPTSCWGSTAINWNDSTLFGRERSFIWVHVEVVEMLKLYSPVNIIPKKELQPLSDSYALASSDSILTSQSAKPRGRRPLPWEKFNVEVARMYRDITMPKKKEAAIAALQEWFFVTTGRRVARSTIGQKLKPYFDELAGKDKKAQ